MKIDHKATINPSAPGTRRAFSTFPALVYAHDGKLLATYRVGSTKDSEDETIELRESSDEGLTWSEPRNPFPDFVEAGRRYSLKLAYLTLLPNGNLLVAAMAVDRTSHPGKPLFNESQGCLPMRILLANSYDNGFTWSTWRAVDTPPEIGPPSLTNRILQLRDGRLVMSLESNKHYDDSSPWFQSVTYLYSADEGRTWGNPVVVSQDPTGRLFNWDQRAGVTPDGAIVTFTWLFDGVEGVYRNIRKRYSLDGGASWSGPEDLGFADQPSQPAIFGDGRIVLAWVDRFGTQTIRARVANGVHESFDASTEITIYEAPAASASGESGLSETLIEMSRWTYGLPFVQPLRNGGALAVYYAGSTTGTGIFSALLSLER